MTNENKLPAALYSRVSTASQDKEKTIESQVSEIKKQIKLDGNFLNKDCVFVDNGWSGELLARPSLDRMRDAAKEGKFKILYVYDRGRLSRVFYHQELVIDELREAGIYFVSLHDLNGVTPEERVLQSMQGVFHEFEKAKISERFRRGKIYKARQGKIINGSALFGYSYIKKTDYTDAKIKINKEETEIVRMIFKWFVEEGLSIRGIIKRLYVRKIMPRKRRQDVWTKGPVVRMLKCKTYFDGKAYYNKSQAVVAKNPINKDKYKKVKRTSRRVRPREEWISFKIPKIFDDDFLYKKAQKILESNKRYASKNKKYNYLLTGKIYCEHGYRRVGDGYSKGLNHYYRSSAKIYNFPKESECDCAGVNAVVLDNLFWKNLLKNLTNEKTLKIQAKSWLKNKVAYLEEYKKEADRIKGLLNNTKQERIRYTKLFGKGIIEADEYEDLMTGLREKKREHLSQLKDIQEKRSKRVDVQIDIDSLCKEAKRVIKSLDTTDKKLIIRDLVEKIVVGKGGNEVKTWINIPVTQAHLMGYGPKRRDSGAT